MGVSVFGPGIKDGASFSWGVGGVCIPKPGMKEGATFPSITLYTWTGVRVKTYGEFVRSQARCEGKREFCATHQAVPQHGPWDVRPTQRYPLKQINKEPLRRVTAWTLGRLPHKKKNVTI